MNCTTKITTIGLTLLLLLSTASPVVAKGTANVSNTVHNLSLSTSDPTSLYKTNEQQVCIFCHTPHGGSLTGPLWNRQTPYDVVGFPGFTFYDSATISATVKGVAAVSPESLMCLGCHDGSVSINHLLNYGQTNPIATSFNSQTNTKITGTPGANMRIGGSPANPGDVGQLGDDHPISFSYRAVYNGYVAVSKAGLVDPDSVDFTDSDIRLFGADERVECSSCHDPHVDYEGVSTDHAPFLIMSNAGSALCLACHDK